MNKIKTLLLTFIAILSFSFNTLNASADEGVEVIRTENLDFDTMGNIGGTQYAEKLFLNVDNINTTYQMLIPTNVSGIRIHLFGNTGGGNQFYMYDLPEDLPIVNFNEKSYYLYSLNAKELKPDITTLHYLKLALRRSTPINTNEKVYFVNYTMTLQNINNLTFTNNNQEIVFNYFIPPIDNFSHIELYQDGQLLVDNIETNNFTVTNLEYDTNYSFTFYVVDTDGNKSSGVTRKISIPENPNLIPSGNIFNLTHTVTDKTVNFKYNLPTDDRFSHLKVYRNNELITDTYNLSEYTDRELEPETEYEYRFVTVNKENILSNGYTVTIKTAEENDDVPPAIPTGLTAKGMNAGIMLTWNGNTESDLQGYYIYIDGEKNNNTPIRNNYYNLTNLNNGQTYNIQVSSVDTFNNESEKTSVRTALPNADEMPILELDTNLSSIAGSVENWFSEIWLLVAFASAIPLAFMIGSRVKALFIA